jgi:acyl-CoA synthetase (AMP-forming)/AMP-acid ligase II
LRTLVFLLFDHIAGLDTLFYTLSSGGTLIIPERRDPDSVCSDIEKHRVEVLPTSPSFLNLLLLSHAYEKYDLSSLKIITYGSEPMSQVTLGRVSELFPKVRIIQKYGTSEFGSPHSKSRSSNDLWMRLDSDQFQVKVIDGILWMKAKTSMVGYLNAPSPFDEDGWTCTGDEVEVDDGWLKILGRQSDIINVGGEKVYPAEIEAVISQMDIVADVLVKGEPHPLLGQCVCAKVLPIQDSEPAILRKEVRRYCRQFLQPFKVPTKIEIVTQELTSARQKKIRS